MGRLHILIIVNSLQSGGAERAAVRLAEDLVADGNKVTLATWYDNRDFYKIENSGICRINLGDILFQSDMKFTFPYLGLGHRLNQFHNLWKLRNKIMDLQPNVVISFEALIGVVTSLALIGSRIPQIVSERVDPNPLVYSPHSLARKLRPLIYRTGTVCSVQTKGFQNWVSANWKIDAIVTPNHLPSDWVRRDNLESRRQKKIVMIGRFAKQKDHETFLRAWSCLEFQFPDWQVEIWGPGDDSDVRKIISNLNLKNVLLKGATEQIRDVLDSVEILVSSSIFEGFPNVVLEAMARGCAVVATQSSDVIELFAKEGAVIETEIKNHNQMEEKLRQLMEDHEGRINLQVAAINLSERFTWSEIKIHWYSLISEAIQQAKTSSVQKLISEKRFRFGKNWRNFSKQISREKIEMAEVHLKDRFQSESLEGRFVDIGCGSGLFSLAAMNLGAKVLAFDYDKESVATTRRIIDNSQRRSNSIICRADVLNSLSMRFIQDADFVYAWGVLHHTGSMWNALADIARNMKSGSRFVFAIYNDEGSSSEKWLKIKKAYVSYPPLRLPLCMYTIYSQWRHKFINAHKDGTGILNAWKNYKQENMRGMSAWHDVVDWTGGYPYEVSSREKMVDFMKGFNLKLLKVWPNDGSGNNEFLFVKLD
jgi:2-polyprenyl-6-hydroxyphenyl methylase/3-demethylubiquinone-9 3-methyltransferase